MPMLILPTLVEAARSKLNEKLIEARAGTLIAGDRVASKVTFEELDDMCAEIACKAIDFSRRGFDEFFDDFPEALETPPRGKTIQESNEHAILAAVSKRIVESLEPEVEAQYAETSLADIVMTLQKGYKRVASRSRAWEVYGSIAVMSEAFIDNKTIASFRELLREGRDLHSGLLSMHTGLSETGNKSFSTISREVEEALSIGIHISLSEDRFNALSAAFADDVENDVAYPQFNK